MAFTRRRQGVVRCALASWVIIAFALGGLLAFGATTSAGRGSMRYLHHQVTAGVQKVNSVVSQWATTGNATTGGVSDPPLGEWAAKGNTTMVGGGDRPLGEWAAQLPGAQAAWVAAAAAEAVPTLTTPEQRSLVLALALRSLSAAVPGDFVDAGAAAGGVTVLLLRALAAFDAPGGGRRVWAADSFDGLPDTVAADLEGGLRVGKRGEFKFLQDILESSLERFAVNDSQRVTILPGWFRDSLPKAGIEKVAFLRLAGSLYSSTLEVLNALYDRVSPGGFVYAEDYGSYNGCRKAIDEFLASRTAAGVVAPLQVDPQSRAAWWVKPLTPGVDAAAVAAAAAAAAAAGSAAAASTPTNTAAPAAAADSAAPALTVRPVDPPPPANPPPPSPPTPDPAVLERIKLTIGSRPTDTYYYYEDGYYAYPSG